MSHEMGDSDESIAGCIPEQRFPTDILGFGLRAVDIRYNHGTKPEPISFNRMPDELTMVGVQGTHTSLFNFLR